MSQIKLFWNKSLHPGQPSSRLIEAAKKQDYLSFLHDSLFDVPDDKAIAPSIRSGGYEYFELSHIKSVLKSGDVFVDIGANIGLYSVVASKIVGNTGRVIAIEPYDTCYLYKNTYINECENLTIVNAAVGKEEGFQYLQLEEGNFGNVMAKPEVSSRPVFTLKLDTLLKNCRPPQVIKIDTQGAELDILEGGINSIRKASLLVEVSPIHLQERGQNLSQLLDFLTDTCGYKLGFFSPHFQKDGKILFEAGCSLEEISKEEFQDLMAYMLSNTYDFFVNLWCTK